MGWGGFDFGKVLKHLRSIGVETLTWDGQTVTVTPASAQEKVHTDVVNSLLRGAPYPITLTLREPDDRMAQMERWAKGAYRRLSRSRNQTDPGTDAAYAEQLLPLLTPPDPQLQAEAAGAPESRNRRSATRRGSPRARARRQARIEKLELERTGRAAQTALDAVEFPWAKPEDGMYSNDAPTEPCEVEFASHTVRFSPTDQSGIHSGRSRVRVECLTCGVVVHKATTGPRSNARMHWQAVLEGRA